MNRKPFSPTRGKIYKNKGDGSLYKCLDVWYRPLAIMQNQVSGWTFKAKGVGIYEDGTIDWDYSTGGYFSEVK